eukprot:CAMPEP_0176483472 /NCGR_PEP_ID=MMETSP0200_2-20121128/3936_1 /TAXON_ID=947934 /ORGANISM="Chaetoceros sp., Strain GSL56" /LENGTH=491 /DNA_ID=CAMNT_0017879875 /DNA_START=411 /DNA_END=1883 /DNA_ORIENTATION=-
MVVVAIYVGTTNTSSITSFSCLLPLTSSYISPQCGFHPEWHPPFRKDRFPSVDDRVKLYMSTWYLPPCFSNERLQFQYLFIAEDKEKKKKNTDEKSKDNHNKLTPPVRILQYTNNNNFRLGQTIHQDHHIVTNITLGARMEPDIIFTLNEHGFKRGFGRYPQDAQRMLNLYYGLFSAEWTSPLAGTTSMTTQLPPIVITLGDGGGGHFTTHPIPYFCKWRPIAKQSDLKSITTTTTAASSDENVATTDPCIRSMEERGGFGKIIYSNNNQTTFAPIVWALEYHRHFGNVNWVPWLDTFWENKKNAAIWRGVLTGTGGRVVKGDLFVSNCQRVPRCNFVMNFKDSKILDVGVSFQLDWFRIEDDEYAESMVKGKVSLKRMMQYKAIIIYEGNDVASGLKWALYSRSVVMMPEPTKTSFAMEELLIPWVHYIPLMSDGSDAEERMKWVLENDVEARKISERATLFMYDLLFHENSVQDNMDVEMEILRRYYHL